MTINFTFNNLDEMEDTILRLSENIEAGKIFKAGVPEKKEEPKKEEAPKAEPKKEEAPKAEPEKEEPSPEPVPTDPAPQKKIDRTEMRKLLAALNKETGKNTARELITGMGYRVLTDVPDDRLGELMAKAEEVLNA